MIYLDENRRPISRDEYLALQQRRTATRSSAAPRAVALPAAAPDPARAPDAGAGSAAAPSANLAAMRAQLEAEIAETRRAVEAERRAVIGRMARPDHTTEEAAVLQACLEDPSCTPAEASRRLAPARAARILRVHGSSSGRTP